MAAAPTEPTAPQRVLLRLCVPDEALAASGAALLGPEDRPRLAAIIHPRARREYLVGRWLLRSLLAPRLPRERAERSVPRSRSSAPPRRVRVPSRELTRG